MAKASRIVEVLIADDDPSYLTVLERTLGRMGLPTVSCTDGSKAWAAIEERPGLFMAVMNWMLPGLDGHEICRRLHERKSPVTPVLMVGRDFLQEAWSRLDLRGAYVLAKPFSEAEIDQQVARLIRLASSRNAGGAFSSA